MTFTTDPFTGNLRLIAPERAKRLELVQDGCPFCVGNEHLTPAESWRSSDPGTGAWLARSFPNMFPLVDGIHDVLVPTPRHVTSLRELTDLEWLQLAELWTVSHARLTLGLTADQSVLIFCNDGPGAGASIEHVHAHAAVVPAISLAERIGRVSATDTCPSCAVSVDTALHVASIDGCVIAAHPAPIASQGLVMTSKEHESALPRVATLARAMSAAVDATPPGTDLNIWLISDFRAACHWYMEIMPRTGYLAGMELALGTGVTTVTPVDAAVSARARLATHAQA